MNKLINFPCASLSTLLLRSAITLLALITLASCKDNAPAASAPSALEVKAVRATATDLPKVMEFLGQTKGSVDAEIRARVDGVITALHFKEGSEVQQGQLLYSIDSAPYQAKVAEARAKVAEAEASLAKADSDLKRIRPLVEMKALAARELDRAVAQESTARASVDAAKAGLQSANIELGYCEISSPTQGIIGLTKAKVGEYVGRAPNPVVLNIVSNLDPIHVLLSINEKEYLYFTRLRQKQIEAGQQPQNRKLQMILADGSAYSELGEVVSLGRAIDPSTGSIPVEAAFPNPHKLIRPGQFAKIKATAETIQGAIVLPKRALRELQGQYQVFVVKSDNTTEIRSVTVGSAIGDKQVIEGGLSEGEVVVVDGLQRLTAGMAVAPKFDS